MVKMLLVLNALLTVPFGVFALAMPSAVFARFGLQLNDSGALVARGFGTTLVAYRLALWLLRRNTDRHTVRALLVSMVLLNTIEAVIQGIAGAQGVAAKVIFGNVVVHAAVAALCMIALLGNGGMRPAAPPTAAR